MITNLLRPWILARLLSGGAALALCLFGTWIAWRVLRHWQVGATSEGQLALERRAELVAAVVQVAFVGALVNTVLTVLAADRLTHSIRGAMCAWGVFDASPWGFTALGTTTLSASLCAFWMVLHRLDLRTRRPRLTRRKFVWLFALTPVLAFDLLATSRWVLDLDMSVVASCCSVGLDDALRTARSDGASPHRWSGWVALVTSVSAAAASFRAWRRPGRFTAWSTTLLSGAAGTAAVPAILWVVAPHAYETPHHLCPFCLLHADVWGLGWPLFGALFTAAVCGLSTGLVETQRHASGEPEVALTLQRRLGGWAAASWMVATVIAALPILRYMWITGGLSLFGAT